MTTRLHGSMSAILLHPASSSCIVTNCAMTTVQMSWLRDSRADIYG